MDATGDGTSCSVAVGHDARPPDCPFASRGQRPRPPSFPARRLLIAPGHPRRIRADILPLRRLLPSSEPVRAPVYKTAALPTELHRPGTRCMVAHPEADVRICIPEPPEVAGTACHGPLS